MVPLFVGCLCLCVDNVIICMYAGESCARACGHIFFWGEKIIFHVWFVRVCARRVCMFVIIIRAR